MADHSKPQSHHDQFCGMYHFANVCRSCKSFLLMRRSHSDKNHSSPNKIDAGKDLNPIDEKTFKDLNNKKNQHKKTMNIEVPNPPETNGNIDTSSPRGCSVSLPSRLSSRSQPLRTSGNTMSRNPSRLSKSASQKSQSSTATSWTSPAASVLKSMSRKSSTTEGVSGPASVLSTSSSTKILYSNSNGVIKPPAIEQTLDCTLEEICFGCIKKIKITRDVVTHYGQIVQEDEVLTVKVKPGWRTGTKITFEGMGNETPGGQTSDMTFVVAEKQHPLFRKEGDDLVLGIDIPLVRALAGSTLSIPLLGGENMNLEMEDTIIYPGFEKIVVGQGMPRSKEQGERGNLIVKYLVEFPKELTDEERSDVFNILKDSC